MQVQALVQSRLGQPVVQNCTVHSDPTDWFSIRIDELGEIVAQLRTSVSNYPPTVNYFTLDFLLYTADSDILPLESWCINFDPNLLEANVNIRTELYHRLSTLLKSVMIASRMTPTYRYYTREQSPDTFIIMYRVYEGKPEMDLSEGNQRIRVGSITSPFGGFHIDLFYRTKMEINSNGEELKIINPLQVQMQINSELEFSGVSREITMIPFGPVATQDRAENISPVSNLISVFTVSPNEKNLDFVMENSMRKVHFHLSRSHSSSDDSYNHRRAISVSDDENVFAIESSDCSAYSSSLPHPKQLPIKNQLRTHSFPFMSLLTTTPHCFTSDEHLPQLLEDNDNSSTPELSALFVNKPLGSHQHVLSVAISSEQVDDSYVNKVKNEAEAQAISEDDSSSSDDSFVKVAFGSGESIVDGLGEFMKQCRSAPTHLSFHADNTTVIPDMLKQFQVNQEMFDDFVAKVHQISLKDEDLQSQ